ncbi:DUF962 domain-containing protein [Ascidiimonas aurantiaca]|uniref:Mpo1 family 2-hydroxy fatty acid dioxygenase n=1 Tax=Ascidiimonas aurantiaca TaxID=1685432 RepID=UPI0030EE29A6
MKTLDQWFREYGVSHQNKTNKAIHYICVPAIFFSIVGLLMSIPAGFLERLFPFENPLIENWATMVLIAVLFFYVRLSLVMALKILLFAAVCVIVNHWIGQFAPLWIVSLAIFVIAWIGQFYGHKIEGKKPSFLKDLQFLLIGPAWVMDNIFKKS